MKKLLLILICLFVSFDVRSKESGNFELKIKNYFPNYEYKYGVLYSKPWMKKSKCSFLVEVTNNTNLVIEKIKFRNYFEFKNLDGNSMSLTSEFVIGQMTSKGKKNTGMIHRDDYLCETFGVVEFNELKYENLSKIKRLKQKIINPSSITCYTSDGERIKNCQKYFRNIGDSWRIR